MTDQAQLTEVDATIGAVRRLRRALLAVYAIALLVMGLVPPIESEHGGVKYVSVFERPERYAARPVPLGTDLAGWVEEQERGRGPRMGKAPVMWGRVATQVVWLSLLSCLAFAAAPGVVGLVRQDL